MRRRALLLLASTIASFVVTTLPAPTVEAAGPPACPFTNTTQRYCNRYTATGARGSIGLLGDSVLLGSADGASNPGLPSMLAANGFGPINLIATLGMKNAWPPDNNVSASYWINRWHVNDFHPSVIALNLGANHFSNCTAGNPAPCKTLIDTLLNEIAVKHPGARVWWAKVVQKNYPSGTYSTGMLGWNAALDQAAAQRPNLILWDWPTALATANPPITMDLNSIHPLSGTQYVKRSTLMADHITTQMSSARYAGPQVAPPVSSATPLSYVPLTEAVVYTGARFGAGETRDIDLSGVAAITSSTKALALTVRVGAPSANGYLLVYRCGDTPPTTSSLNYSANVARAAQVITRISDARHICVYTSAAADVIIQLQGDFVEGAGARLFTLAPTRPLDTRLTGRAQDLVVDVPDTDAVAVTVTTNGVSNGGSLTVYGCGSLPDTKHVLFQANETVAAAAFVPVSADGTICVHVETGDANYTEVIVDVTGSFDITGGSGGYLFVPAPSTRLLDTRNALGGWIGRHGIGQTIALPVAPAGAMAVTGTITMVRPTFNGYLRAYQCGQAMPATSTVNAPAGLVMASSVTVGIEPTQRTLCLFSSQSTHTLFDVTGWWVGTL